MSSGPFEPEIGRDPVASILYIVIVATAIITIPQLMAADAGAAGWMGPLVALPAGLAALFIVFRFSDRFPGLSLIEALPRIVGQWPAKLLGVLFALFFIYVGGNTALELDDFVIATALPTTPSTTIAFFAGGLELYLVWLGIRVMGRVSAVIAFVHLLAIGLIVILALPHIRFDYLLPVFGYRPAGILKAGAHLSGWFGEALVVTFLIRRGQIERGYRTYAYGMLCLIGLALALATAVAVGLLGETSSAVTYPLLSVTRFITVGTFARIDPLAIGVWMVMGAIKVACFILFAALALAQTFGLRDYRPLLLPLDLAIHVLGVALFPDYISFLQHAVLAWPPISFSVELLLPALILLVAFARNARAEQSA